MSEPERCSQQDEGRVDACGWQRAATPSTQAILVLRWFKDATRVHLLARDAGISVATAYRYLHEAIDVIASTPRTCPTSSPSPSRSSGRTCA